MKLLKKGAEGDIYLTRWNGKKAILKTRKVKKYRNSTLDFKIRTQRTVREAEIIVQVKSYGISTPLVYFVDSKNSTILMQYIQGVLVRDLQDSHLIKICKEIGQVIGNLHKSGIMHGDLTTSNFIVSEKRIFLIDFGLASRTEKHQDFAIDLRLFKEILNSAHTIVMKKAWPNFLEGYKKSIGYEDFHKIINLVSVIEARGRYATVV